MKHNNLLLLNKEQFKSVTVLDGPLLVIAGAGSGKTRVITYRIAFLLENGYKQNEILAVTFTNKAAMEMKQRIKKITGLNLRLLTVSTFHAFGVKILKKHGHLLGYKKNFSIYDQPDKDSLIKDILADEGPVKIDNTQLLSNFFSKIKMNQANSEDYGPEVLRLYHRYQANLKAYNAVDFDDLILLPLKLFSSYPDILKLYQDQYRHILIDEFQDTSEVQYKLIKILGRTANSVCAVGDDDQSIYSWRGANFGNIMNFQRDFRGTLEIKLEQNYRSTPVILNAANELIKRNSKRKGKTLRSVKDESEPIIIHMPQNERMEGEWIAEMIRTLLVKHNLKYHDFAVLVRTNHLTKPIEEAFLRDNLPYKVSGGISFFQRREIKDIISYLKILANPDDNINLLRIINVPRRGIGLKTIEKIANSADAKGISIYSLISSLRFGGKDKFEKKILDSLIEFVTLLDYYREKIMHPKKIAATVKSMIEKINYWGYLLTENKKKQVAQWKYQNIMSLLNSIKDYEYDPDNLSASIYDYLNRITLNTKDEQPDMEKGKVQLMTIHSAKGLEFDTVFIAGLEEGLIPHARALSDDERILEEERRLLYVALTRAKNRLLMTSCKTRRKMGQIEDCNVSPFLEEIPERFYEYYKEKDDEQGDSSVDFFEKFRKKVLH